VRRTWAPFPTIFSPSPTQPWGPEHQGASSSVDLGAISESCLKLKCFHRRKTILTFNVLTHFNEKKNV
jgi:hypothetical protein